jgi:hypothetical protein
MLVGDREIEVSGRFCRIARAALDWYECPDDPATLCESLRDAGTRVDLFTFMQQVPNRSPRFAYPMEWDNVAVLRVSTFERWRTAHIDKKGRKALRIAERSGIAVREVPFDDALVRGITAVYNECPIRQGKPFSHYGKDVEMTRRANATFLERSIFIGAFLEETLVGFAKLVCDRDRRQAGFMQIVSMVRHHDKAPTRALIGQAVRSCAERQIRYLLFASFTYGRKRGDGLSEFKALNGFQRVELPRYYVPLTVLGHAALRLGLHRPAAMWVPEPLLSRLRGARRRWYERRLPVAGR